MQRIGRELKPFLGVIVVLLVYALVRITFTSMSGSRGMLERDGSLDTTLAVLAFATFVLRFAALVILPGIVVYRLVMRAARHVSSHRE